jgi:hypothetical protein
MSDVVPDPTAEFDFEGGYDLPESVDDAAIERMRAVARVFDDLIQVPGTDISVGLDPIVGVVPAVGDAVSAGVSLYVVLEAANLGVSYTTLLRMLGNVTLDAAGGLIPYVGTAFDAVFRANKRNLELVLADLAESGGGAEPVEIDIEA